MIKFTKEQIILIHSICIQKSGGIDSLRDESLLESALNTPFQTFSGEELYPTIQRKAAMLCYTLINNHPFIDGNKRIGILILIAFLELNGIYLNCTNDEVITLGLGIASGKITSHQISNWIISHSI